MAHAQDAPFVHELAHRRTEIGVFRFRNLQEARQIAEAERTARFLLEETDDAGFQHKLQR